MHVLLFQSKNKDNWEIKKTWATTKFMIKFGLHEYVNGLCMKDLTERIEHTLNIVVFLF